MHWVEKLNSKYEFELVIPCAVIIINEFLSINCLKVLPGEPIIRPNGN
jgi:hypothetical protein